MLLITVLVFFAIAVVGAMYGTKYYVRPKEAMDRVVGTVAARVDRLAAHVREVVLGVGVRAHGLLFV